MIYYNDFSKHQYGEEMSDFIAFYAAKIAGIFYIIHHNHYCYHDDYYYYHSLF